MPITACFLVMAFLAMILLIPIVPISLILRHRGRRRIAMTLLGLPVGLIVLSALLTVLILVTMWRYDVRMSRNPVRLFESTFGFHPTPGIEVLEGYCGSGLDSETRAMRFRAPPEAIARITSGRFVACDRGLFMKTYHSSGHNLPQRVQSWFVSAAEGADRFYLARPFDKSFTTSNEAILCYEEKGGIACFHWFGVD